jgi:16S rRNA (cytidine1402-2'-O)-methyltransferase
MDQRNKGTLYLIPCTLGEGGKQALPEYIRPVINTLTHFIVENEKTARRFLKSFGYEHSLDELTLYPLNKHTDEEAPLEYLMPLLSGTSMGVLSEAGMPGIADPGAIVVQLAHENQVKVVPLSGPSSIFLALAASGMNGQNFAFNGYVPFKNTDRKIHLQQLERLSAKANQTQIFIETPFRNNQMLEDILQSCRPETRLCLACDITLQTESIKTRTIEQWKKEKKDLNKRPVVFLLYAGK